MLNVVFKPHRTHLKADTADVQKVFAMLQLIPKPEVAQARPPLALALVIDTSGSMQEYADQQRAQEEIQKQGMQGQQQATGDGSYQAFDLSLETKLDQAIAAAHALIDDIRLSPGDQVTVIHFDDEAKPLLRLTPLANKHAAHQAIESLRQCSGGTHMAKGMHCAQQELRSLSPQVAKRALLLTDGQTFDEPACRPLAGQFAEANTPLIAIGIGAEYNEALLRDLAAVSQGRPYHLQTMTQLHEILTMEVGSSVHEVVTDVQATVSVVKGVTLDSLTRVYTSLSEVPLAHPPYRLGNIVRDEYTVFVLEFTVAGIARPASRARLAQVGLTGHVPGLGRRDELPPRDLFVTFTTDEAATTAIDQEVMGYVQQKNMDRMVQEAMQQATGDPGRARQTLQVAMGMTQRIGNAAMTLMLHNALDELNKTGTLSVHTRKTVALGGRTKTVKAGSTMPLDGGLSQEEIRTLTGA